MTYGIVITFEIRQSAGKVSKNDNVKFMILPQRPHGDRFTMKEIRQPK